MNEPNRTQWQIRCAFNGFCKRTLKNEAKLTLTIKEAAEYSNIGINKIDTLLKQPNFPFVLFVGTRKLVKRREFEEYIRRELIIWNFYQQLLQKIPVEIEKAESLCYNV